jgi:hypothetical protein
MAIDRKLFLGNGKSPKKMKYDVGDIREHNQRPHLDIEGDIQAQKNGQFTFILRVNNGNIVDYSVVEYADIRNYLVLTKVIIEEFTVPRGGGGGGQENALRPNNFQRESQGRSSSTDDNKHSEEQEEEVST